MKEHIPRLVWTWVGLLLLLGATLGSAFVPMGMLNSAVNLVIAAAKALLVALVFMELRAGPAAIRGAALIGLALLAVLFGLSAADYATRVASPAPWVAPASQGDH